MMTLFSPWTLIFFLLIGKFARHFWSDKLLSLPNLFNSDGQFDHFPSQSCVSCHCHFLSCHFDLLFESLHLSIPFYSTFFIFLDHEMIRWKYELHSLIWLFLVLHLSKCQSDSLTTSAEQHELFAIKKDSLSPWSQILVSLPRRHPLYQSFAAKIQDVTENMWVFNQDFQ